MKIFKFNIILQEEKDEILWIKFAINMNNQVALACMGGVGILIFYLKLERILLCIYV